MTIKVSAPPSNSIMSCPEYNDSLPDTRLVSSIKANIEHKRNDSTKLKPIGNGSSAVNAHMKTETIIAINPGRKKITCDLPKKIKNPEAEPSGYDLAHT